MNTTQIKEGTVGYIYLMIFLKYSGLLTYLLISEHVVTGVVVCSL